MQFTDIHAHVLAGVDDGPQKLSQMYALLDALCRDQVVSICCTPHYHPGYYGNNSGSSMEMYQLLTQYAKCKYPNLQLCLGNELHYSPSCIEWLESGECLTLNGTRNILVDFDYDESYSVIEFAVFSFLRHGFIPVLAHIERYPALRWKSKCVEKLHNAGAIIQVNASSVLQPRRYPNVRKLLQHRIVDVVASDTHSMEHRPPELTAAYEEVSRRYGKELADALFFYNPNAILNLN
ncbi:CpsB/CapC family capsule biosynthesis tyrosine phosphatase [Ruthenibacterium sp. CLA-JM-H11]|uniref:protein-tyrosine-phosphatase n=1 Tax=Ruthenibacterium intestinale TaxID=3133163 RepID=A0ABV1GIM9_9FIRM